jgi:general secretion pathway protein M
MRTQIDALRARCSEVWQARAPRERLIIAVLAVLLGVGLSAWFVYAVERARAELRASVPALRARAERLEADAVEFERLRAKPAPTVSPTDLRALVQAQTGATGLTRAVVSMDAANANQVKVVFGAVAFADWLNWVAGLESQRVQLGTCRIEALAAPGMVSVTATLNRPQPP